MEPADRRKPMRTPSQIVVPEFDPDPTVEEFHERVYTRYELTDGGELVGYLYADHAPTGEEWPALLRMAGIAR